MGDGVPGDQFTSHLFPQQRRCQICQSSHFTYEGFLDSLLAQVPEGKDWAKAAGFHASNNPMEGVSKVLPEQTGGQ